MRHVERRGPSRVACSSAAAYLTHHRHTSTTLVVDLSAHGVRLRGLELPAPGAWISLSISLPPHEVSAAGHVAWHDHDRHAIGIQLGDGSPYHHHVFADAFGQIADEHASGRHGALLLVDDPVLAAQLCDPLRRHGYLPHAVMTPLDAIAHLTRDRPQVELAIVSACAFSLPAAQLLDLLATEYPNVARIQLVERDDERVPGSDEALTRARAGEELDALLDEIL